jgi:hypothetical protein
MTWLYSINELGQWLILGWLIWVVYDANVRADQIFRTINRITGDIIKVLQRDFAMRYEKLMQENPFNHSAARSNKMLMDSVPKIHKP